MDDFNAGQVFQPVNPNYNQEVQNVIDSDPRMMAYKRAQGASDAVARAEANQAITSARTAQGNLPQEYADMLGQGLRQISDKFENQGMSQSSNRLRAQNEHQGALQGQMLGQRNALQDNINSANIGLQRHLAEGMMGAAEQGIESFDRMNREAGQYGMDIMPRTNIQKHSNMLGTR